MLLARPPGRRFGLLLLDEGEAYVRDFVAECAWPAGVAGNWRGAPALPGTLRLCTASLFFEPDDARVPIVRLPFAALQALEGRGGRAFVAAAGAWTKMRENAADDPYVFEKAPPGGPPAAWGFTLPYARLDDFMPPAQQMLVASRLPAAEREAVLAGVTAAAEAAAAFDAGHLRSAADESVLLELPAALLSPLTREPGRLALTQRRLYFQPLHDIGGDAPARSHPLAAVAAVARRRSGLRDVGLEVFFVEPGSGVGGGGGGGTGGGGGGSPGPKGAVSAAAGPFWGGASAFLAFRSRDDRERAAEALGGRPELGAALPGGRGGAAAVGSLLEAGGGWLPRATAAWQRGALSNFDYLLFLNLAAGRSFQDLSQYPVFPWVLADYTSPALDLADPASFRDLSKPVGALDAGRLAHFRRRFAEMAADPAPAEPPFLYGTHYSCPAYCLYWLVRAAPGHMLRLQAGRFDAPDRLFTSVARAWRSATSNQADVKELIPEFFLPGAERFLVNGAGLRLGTRQDGRPVGDVDLPPWAAGPADFLARHRAALETPAVSAGLHRWIDLVFGAAQRGAAAERADNVFRAITYEGGVDVDALADPAERAAAELQAAEFGTCPRALFAQPHPPRLVAPPAPDPAALAAAAAAGGGGGTSALSLALVAVVMAAAGDGDGAALPPEPLAAPSPAGPEDGGAGAAPAAGAWGVGLRERLRLRHSIDTGPHAINALALAAGGGGGAVWAYAANHCGSLKIYDAAAGRQARAARLCDQPLAGVCVLPEALPSVASDDDAGGGGGLEAADAPPPLAVAAAFDGRAYAYAPAGGAALGSWAAHGDVASCVAAVGRGAAAALATASWDATVRLWALGEGRQPWGAAAPAPAAAAALPGGCWALAPAGDGAPLLVAGTEDGAVALLDLRAPRAVAWLARVGADYVGGIAASPDGGLVVAAGGDGALTLLDARAGGAARSAAGAGAPLRCAATDGRLAAAGGEDGGLRLWDVGQQLGGRPAVGAAPGAAAPGIDGLYPPAGGAPPGAAAANALGAAGGGGAPLWVVVGHEDGALRAFCAGG